MLNPVNLSCLVSLSLYLIFHADDSFRDFIADRIINPEKSSSLSVSLSHLSCPWFLQGPLADRTLNPCLSVSLPHFSCRWFLQGPLPDRMLGPEKHSCPVSLSLYLTFRAAGPFRDPPGRPHAQSSKNLLVLSLCLSAPVPLVPTGTPWQSACSLLNPEKPSCPVSLSLYLTFRAAGSFRDPLAERMLIV